jgi:hypothetical protein
MTMSTPSRVLAIATTMLLVVAMAVPALANTNGDCAPCGEYVTDLIAGGGNDKSAMDVGDVVVRNCESTVCVDFVLSDDAIADGWKITETHVEIAADVDGIPQTKKDNPIPGQFEDVQYFMPGVETYRYCASFDDIAPGLMPGDTIAIAAHAVVTRPAPGEWTEVWMIGDVEGVSAATGLLTNYADEFNWESPAGPDTMGPSLAVSQPTFANPFIVGSSETTDFPYNSNADRGYATDFDVQWDGALPWGGRLTVSWSPGQSAYEEKNVMVSGDGMPSATWSAVGTPRAGEGWFQDKYALVQDTAMVGPLAGGTHTINFKHPTGDGTFWDWLLLEQPGLESETAWGDGCDFDGKNWATYICYTIADCCEPCEAPFYASEVLDSNQGDRKDGTAVRPGRSVPEAALTYEATGSETDFFSLGFGGDITLGFPCAIVDGEGDDLKVVEDTWGYSYPLETADVYAWDGAGWVLLGTADNTAHGTYWQTESYFDLADVGLASTSMIKIVDTTAAGPHNNSADGFDVNWVEVLHDSTVCP